MRVPLARAPRHPRGCLRLGGVLKPLPFGGPWPARLGRTVVPRVIRGLAALTPLGVRVRPSKLGGVRVRLWRASLCSRGTGPPS